MRLLDTTLATPELNLALDEALLLSESGGESLRLWESPTPLVVLGRSSRAEGEVDLAACRNAGVPVLRRPSGGATVVAGPGCLMYAVLLGDASRTGPPSVEWAHRRVLGELCAALRGIDPRVRVAGTSDLAIDELGVLKKFSGNSVRLVRSRMLYHGTLLYGFDLGLIDRLTKRPATEPEYRAGRPHGEFVTNLRATGEQIRAALAAHWGATPRATPERALRLAEQLVREKYSQASWNLSR